MRLDQSGSYHTSVSQYLKASFEIAFIIAKQKKKHILATEIILGVDTEQKIKFISLLNNTVKSQIINRVKLSPFFAINCDESADIVTCAQLIVYVRHIGGNIIEEAILYSQSLTAGTTSEDIINSI
nr:unnamed protein product [Callosobruchus analis]